MKQLVCETNFVTNVLRDMIISLNSAEYEIGGNSQDLFHNNDGKRHLWRKDNSIFLPMEPDNQHFNLSSFDA